jgi:hypothetical protein
VLTFRKKGALLTEAAVRASCQVRSKTESPCPRRAVVEIRGVAFCGPCAREQEAYFAIGELVAREGERDLCGEPLAEALKRLRRERTGRREGTAAGTHHEPSSVHETKSLALR